jgi:cytochrome b561
MRNSPDQYDKLSKAFHWITAGIVVTAFMLGPGDFGQIVDGGVDPATRNDIVWHESLGVAVFVLTFLRLIWVAIRPGAPRHQMSAWMFGLSQLAHFALWALLFLLPISALLALGSESHPLTLLGGIRIDVFPIVGNSYLSNLADWGEIHKLLGDVIIWLAGIHALAAIYHHFRLKDRVLVSMLP